MVTCNNCGLDVNGDLENCPNCGSEIIMEEPKILCPSCGIDIGDSAFCPNCGTKIDDESSKSLCPSCGADVGDSAFCPSCGTKMCGEKQEPFHQVAVIEKSDNISDSALDKLIDVDEKVSGKFGKLLGKSKSMDFVYSKTASQKRKNSEQTVEFYARNEPVFLEVYNLIDDEFVKSIFALEREKLGSVGGSTVGAAMSAVHIPTKNMGHDDAMQFYIDIVNKIVDEINIEKQNGTFDEDEFYTRKYKQNAIDNISTLGVLKAFKSMKK